MNRFYLSPILDEMVLRGLDPTGHGYYGAKRGKRKHRGLDILADPGVTIYAPIDGEITKLGQVYKTKITDKFKYIEITGSVYRVRIFYCDANVKLGSRVDRCQVIGSAQDVAGFWSGPMKNHVHLELYKHGLLTDPESLFENYTVLSY